MDEIARNSPGRIAHVIVHVIAHVIVQNRKRGNSRE